jgi:hypothetical protein
MPLTSAAGSLGDPLATRPAAESLPPAIVRLDLLPTGTSRGVLGYAHLFMIM